MKQKKIISRLFNRLFFTRVGSTQLKTDVTQKENTKANSITYMLTRTTRTQHVRVNKANKSWGPTSAIAITGGPTVIATWKN